MNSLGLRSHRVCCHLLSLRFNSSFFVRSKSKVDGAIGPRLLVNRLLKVNCFGV
jgi:hypothetical protein